MQTCWHAKFSYKALTILYFALQVDLDQELLKGNSLIEHTTIGLDLQGLDVGGSMVLDLKAHKLSSLKIDQLLHPGCLLKVADDVNVSGIYIGFSKSVIKLEAQNGIEVDEELLEALENTGTYVLEAYKTVRSTCTLFFK